MNQVVDLTAGFEWNVPDRFNFSTDVVGHWAANGDPLCLIWRNEAGEHRSFRYSDMADRAARFGAVLRANGIRKGDRVLVVMPRIPEWQIVMVGAMHIGAVPIPSIEMLTDREVAYRVDHSGARAIVARAEHAPMIESASTQSIARISVGPCAGWSNMLETMPEIEPAEPAEVTAEDPVVMYYTSGSTGYPKGVVHSARGVFTWRYSAKYWLDIGPGDTIWCTADTGWSKAGTSILFGPWSQGATSFFYDGAFDPGARLRMIAENGVTVYCAPGTELYRVVQQDIASYDLRKLRRTVSSGEAMNPAVAEAWRAATGLQVHEAYGQTETLMTALTIPGMEVRLGSMGRPAPGCQLAVIDEQGREMGPGEVGHVALKLPNPQMMLGYWRPAAGRGDSGAVVAPDGDWFHTGDLARRDDDGYFWYQGRSDDVINSAGYRIGPTEVENALMEHPAIQECAVIGWPHPERGEVVKAYIVLKSGYIADDSLTSELQAHVKTAAAPYKYPRLIEYRDTLPKGPTGKILRRALRKQS
ncbi:MAG: AMP-binding protein [Alphaproteobacteria bacterium]|nr:AMP-binding protein [Alphaproteobacteria bacterium]MBO6862884.1 AMP-binding protein [Alphaproteobacteria bacterium]